MLNLRRLIELLSPILPKKWDTRLKSTYAMAILFPVVTLYALSPILVLLMIFGELSGYSSATAGGFTLEDFKLAVLWLMGGGAFIGFVSHQAERK